MAASLRLAEKGADIAAAAPSLVASAGQEDRRRARADLDRKAGELAGLTRALSTTGLARDRLAALADVEGRMTAKLQELDNAVERRLAVRTRKEAAVADLAGVHAGFLEKIEPLVDDAGFDLVIGSENLASQGKEAIAGLVGGGVAALRVLLELRAEVNLAVGLLEQASGVPDESALQPLRERFDAALGHVDRLLARLPEAERNGDLGKATEALVAFGRGGGSTFSWAGRTCPRTRSTPPTGSPSASPTGRSRPLRPRRQHPRAAPGGAAPGRDRPGRARGQPPPRRPARRRGGLPGRRRPGRLRRRGAPVRAGDQDGRAAAAAITALGVVGAAAIMLRYVVPRVVSPLEAMTAAMTGHRGGRHLGRHPRP